MPKKQKPRICAVRGCPGDRDLTKTNARLTLLPGQPHLSFFRVPAIISRNNSKYCGKRGTGENLQKMIELSTNRRNAWLKAINKEHEPPDKCIKICAHHFVSGRPAELEDETNVDWIPTLKLVPEENPLGKAKFLIKKLVQKQRDTSFRLKYGLSSEDEKVELKKEKEQPIESHADSSSSVVLSETEGMEEVLIQEDGLNESRAEKIKEVFIPRDSKKEPRAKRKNEVLIGEEPKNEPRAKKMKEVLVREQLENETRAKKMKEVLAREQPENEAKAKEMKEVLAREQPKNEARAKEMEEVLAREQPKNEARAKEMKEVLAREQPENEARAEEIEEVSMPVAPKTESQLEEPAPGVEPTIEKEIDRLKKGEVFLDNEATNSNITNYMLKHSDEENGHWHLRFCKTEKCTPKAENDSEIANGVQAQPSEQKGHYHLRLCTCTSCVLSQSVDNKMYSLKGT